MRELLIHIELVYFIYVRKSTDVEDKQILSVAAQIIELKEFAKRMGSRIAGISLLSSRMRRGGDRQAFVSEGPVSVGGRRRLRR